MNHLTELIARLSPPAFWLCVALILYLSLVPGSMRPHTGASSHFEHVMAYAMTGAVFVPGARHKMARLTAAIGLCWLSGAVEIAQLWIPGRAGEIAGFVWSSAGRGSASLQDKEPGARSHHSTMSKGSDLRLSFKQIAADLRRKTLIQARLSRRPKPRLS